MKFIVLVVCALLSCAGFAREVELMGRVTSLHADDMINDISSTEYFLETRTARRYRLRGASNRGHEEEHPAATLVGKDVTVRALPTNDSELLLIDVTNVTEAAVAVNNNTLVMLGSFKDKALSCSAGSVHARMFGATNSVADLYRETSNGAVTFSGSVYGPWLIPYSSTPTCSLDAWTNALISMAVAQGINLNNFQRRVYVLPQNACPWAGYGSAGALPTSAWVFYCATTDLYAHEIGHGLGFYHARTPSSEYGDKSDVMGQSGHPLREMNAPNKVKAGWIASARIRNVAGSGVFTIDPTASNSVIDQVLVVPKPDTGENYFISLRKPIGYDAGLYSTYQNRVSVHRRKVSSSTYTYLLSTLAAGGVFSDSFNGYRFSVVSIGTNNATVSVEMFAPVCVRRPPGVLVNPYTRSATAGTPVTYQMTITNKNNSGCGFSTFAFTSTIPSGWSSSHSPPTVSMSAGVSVPSTWMVTSASGAPVQSNPLYSKVYDAAATTSATTVYANYSVIK